MSPAKKAAAPKIKPVLTIVTQLKEGAETHWYELGGKSASGRGVTTLIGAGLAAPALAKWGRNTVARVALDERDQWENLPRDIAYEYLRNAPDRERDEAGNRGREVHELAERILAGEEVEVPDALINHVDAYLTFLEEWQPEVLAFEVIGGNLRYHYFGKFDLLVKVKGWFADDADREATVLVDLKTSRSGWFAKDALQLVAYGNFEFMGSPSVHREGKGAGTRWYDDLMPDDLLPMPELDGYAVLHVNSEGAYRLVPVKMSRARKLFATFLHIVRLAEFSGGEYLDRSKWTEEKGWQEDVFEPPHLAPHEAF